MLRSIGWMTFVIVLAIAGHIYQYQPFDQTARNIAATSASRAEVVEQSIQTIDAHSLQSLQNLTRSGKLSRFGEQP